jgi:uncharacterized protein (TIGR03118 family)
MTRTQSVSRASSVLALLSLTLLGGCERGKRYVDVVFERFDLASDRAGLSAVTDANLVNPAGIQVSPAGNFWVANNGTGTVTVYQPNGTPLPVSEPLAVTLPVPATLAAGSTAQPTGIAYYGGYGLEITSGELRASARYLIATSEGTILGYNPDVAETSAVIAVDNSASGAVYRGVSAVALRSGGRLYATNFHSGKVEVFDEKFAPATDLAPAAFEDLELPAGYAPFGIQRADRWMLVSYAEQDAAGRDAVTGPGKGYIDAFGLDGEFLARIASEGELDAPWGMTMAPWSVPYFGGSLLVGNTGDGRINAFDLWYQTPVGGLNDQLNETLVIDGLKDLNFAYGPDGNPTLYFSAGPNDGRNGAFGMLVPSLIDADPPEE